MAEIPLGELVKYGVERPKILVDKVMLLNGKSNTFHTVDDTFEADGVIINGVKTLRTPSMMPSKADELINEIASFQGNTAGNKVEISGKYTGQDRTVVISVGKITKTEEFGGQPAGGKKENKGLVFERELSKSLINHANGITEQGDINAKLASELLSAVCKVNRSPIKEIKQMGGANESRPFAMNGGNVVILPGNPADVGKKLTDITVFHADRTETYLSAKFSSTLTFVNTGVKGPGKPFTEAEVKAGMITNDMGVKLLKALGIDNATFCQVFNLYGTGKKAANPHVVDVTSKVDRTLLESLLRSAIGANYWMVHGQGGGKAYCWWVGPEQNKKYASVAASKFTLYYGGITNGTAKRIDMKFSNAYFDFKLNIRNKQGGIAPTHFLLDYTSKEATGKKLLG